MHPVALGELILVPFIISWPHRFQSGTEVIAPDNDYTQNSTDVGDTKLYY